MRTSIDPALLTLLSVLTLLVMVVSLWDLIRRDRVPYGNKWLWGAVIVILGLPGQILYFLVVLRKRTESDGR